MWQGGERCDTVGSFGTSPLDHSAIFKTGARTAVPLLQGLVGHFINAMAIRVQLAEGDSFLGLVKKVAAVSWC